MMSNASSAIERPARLVVDAVRALAGNRIAVSVTGLALALVAALVYLVGGSLNINPLRSTITVQVLLRDSGGLMPGQDVTLRGVHVGRVDSVQFSDTGVAASADIDSDIPVPQNSKVRVSALSPAGEQYLHFVPPAAGGPALKDGATISENQTSTPVTLSQLLGDADGLVKQLDPAKLKVITDELRVSNQGPAKLQALLDGGAFLITTLDSVLPETTSVIRTSRTVLTTLADFNHGMRHASQNMQSILRGVDSMDGGFRRLVEHGREPLTTLDQIIADNSDTMVKLLGNLTTTGQLMTARMPALNEIFKSTTRSGSSIEDLTSVIHDNKVWVIVDIYPRYSCDYNLPRPPAAVPDYPEPYLHTYCTNPDPSVLVRGARNAPRPPDDDTAGPPPGSDPLAQTDPAPPANWRIPTPFGGSPFPTRMPPDAPDWTPAPGWPGKPTAPN